MAAVGRQRDLRKIFQTPSHTGRQTGTTKRGLDMPLRLPLHIQDGVVKQPVLVIEIVIRRSDELALLFLWASISSRNDRSFHSQA
ncbi:hypothetical protein BJF93_20420 [Xaviernesmea oryzae]|uniref:Uncharacterized protein n=1 Tax=Xaviernesmea oryzae TaxID=464029 RepID=A0A1Q9AVW1_9HYPH|nr:hypothetical protein BJF93_20420 [Xaviernesmea oryzae]